MELKCFKMRLRGPFIGPCTAQAAQCTLYGRQVCPAHIVRPSVSIDQVNVEQLTVDQKKPRVSCLVPRTKSENFSGLVIATQPCQVKLVSIHEQCSFHMQFWGNRMQNYILYPTPLVALEISDKERVIVDTVFCLPSICVLDPKNSKNIIFSP